MRRTRCKLATRFLLYTDGIIEPANADGDFFGYSRLYEVLKRTVELSSSDAADRIVRSVQQWAPNQDDDLTVLVCDYLGPSKQATPDQILKPSD